MQWNCPHCGVALAVKEEVLGTGWSFSRCYKCGGFALVRRVEINVIKVDKAPPGEKVILPEGMESPSTGLVSEEATKKLAMHTAAKPGRVVIPPPPPPQAALNTPHTSPAGQMPTAAMKTSKFASIHKTGTADLTALTLPEPLPETPDQSIGSRALPFGIAIAVALTLVSGAFLFNQSHMLWRKMNSNEIGTRPSAPLSSREVISDQVQQSAMAPDSGPIQDSGVMQNRESSSIPAR